MGGLAGTFVGGLRGAPLTSSPVGVVAGGVLFASLLVAAAARGAVPRGALGAAVALSGGAAALVIALVLGETGNPWLVFGVPAAAYSAVVLVMGRGS